MAATSIGPVISPNFLAGTTDQKYLLHLASANHNQALIEATTDASYAILRFKTPTQDWALALGGDASPTDPSGAFYLFDNSDAIGPLWTIQPGTGDTNIAGQVTAKGCAAMGELNTVGLTAGAAVLDYADPVGRLSVKVFDTPGKVGGIQFIGIDNTGRTLTYMEFAEPTAGNPVAAIYVPLVTPLTLPADPTQPLEAATKQYVDSHIGGGGGMVYPEAGIGVSTGSEWDYSIDPATLAYLDQANTFTQPAQFNGVMQVNSPLYAEQLFCSGNSSFDANFSVAGVSLLAGGNVVIWNRGGVNPGEANANINANGPGLFLNGGTGGPVYLNWDSGNGVQFGNGAGALVGSIDGNGNVLFSGGTTSPGFTALGVSVATPTAQVARLNLGVNGSNDGTQHQGTFIFYTSNPDTNSLHQLLEICHYAPDTGLAALMNMTTGATSFVGNVWADALQTGALTIDGGNILLNGGHLNSGTGVYINWEAGGGGTNFGNGAGALVASIDANGNAHFIGDVSAATKSFRIPHPLDDRHNLTHGCLEGPEFGVYYRGEATTIDGGAEVVLPDYFEALTRPEDRSVQLTQFMSDGDDSGFAMLAASRIMDGKFRIRSSVPTVTVAWLVMAVRRDVAPLEVVTDALRPANKGESKNAQVSTHLSGAKH